MWSVLQLHLIDHAAIMVEGTSLTATVAVIELGPSVMPTVHEGSNSDVEKEESC
jgi:hypothetical protein